jgi:hypothetical protein
LHRDEGLGQVITIPEGNHLQCVKHYYAWIEHGNIRCGPIFRKLTPQGRLTSLPMSAQGVAFVVKAAAAAAGYNPADFSASSLRAGFLTEAGRHNADIFAIRAHSRAASLDNVAKYILERDAPHGDHPGEDFLQLLNL